MGKKDKKIDKEVEIDETVVNEAAEQEIVEDEKVEVVKTPEEELSELKDTLLRKVAEFENFRKRKIKDVQDARFHASCGVIESFLTVYDHFKMAMQSVENGDSLEIVQQGMKMIFSEFGKTFENLGVNEVVATGEKFDPNLHDAISKQSSDEVEEGFVVQQWKSGYKLNDRLLRPAVVVVSSGPETAEEETAENGDSNEETN